MRFAEGHVMSGAEEMTGHLGMRSMLIGRLGNTGPVDISGEFVFGGGGDAGGGGE